MLPGADPALEAILARLDRLENENSRLRDEVRQLRERLDGPPAPLEERVAVAEERIAEQSQSKVGSAEHVPVKLTGMLLFNAFFGGRNGAPDNFPTVVTGGRGPKQIRGTMRQTSVGIDVESPVPVFGAHARGEVMTDLYAVWTDYAVPRLRTGFLDLQWKTRGLRVGVEKPIVAPRNPTSMSQVVYPALWGSGNLWFWQPQFRLEQVFSAGPTEIRAQAGVFQTLEVRVEAPPRFAPADLPRRPGWQGRVQLARRLDQDRRIEFAPGFHYSRTLVASTSAASRLFTADWLIAPSRWWELSGAIFHGKNAAPIGGLNQGVVVLGPGQVRPVNTTGGWGQLMFRPVSRIRLHLMAGEQDDRNRDLPANGIGRNLSWAANTIFQMSPNVLLAIEAQQIRTTVIQSGTRVLNRYDVALGYLF